MSIYHCATHTLLFRRIQSSGVSHMFHVLSNFAISVRKFLSGVFLAVVGKLFCTYFVIYPNCIITRQRPNVIEINV